MGVFLINFHIMEDRHNRYCLYVTCTAARSRSRSQSCYLFVFISLILIKIAFCWFVRRTSGLLLEIVGEVLHLHRNTCERKFRFNSFSRIF